jgi:hypothetical protein
MKEMRRRLVLTLLFSLFVITASIEATVLGLY